MVYRGARRSDTATQGKTATEDLHMDMDDREDREQLEMVTMILQPHGAQCYRRCLIRRVKGQIYLVQLVREIHKMTFLHDQTQERLHDEMLSQNE